MFYCYCLQGFCIYDHETRNDSYVLILFVDADISLLINQCVLKPSGIIGRQRVNSFTIVYFMYSKKKNPSRSFSFYLKVLLIKKVLLFYYPF